MAKLEFMVVALFEMSRKAVRDFFSKKMTEHAVSDCRNVVPTNSTGSVHRIHTHSVHDVPYSLLTSTNMKCVLVAQEPKSSDV